ncbi:MAG: right-handed parallel beta-helix repeat-containing protein, partial [Thermoplasmata archaeon]|nr:right-handed parallel beta-helix repeat-containing protein [Thermoplasmata archaeon]
MTSGRPYLLLITLVACASLLISVSGNTSLFLSPLEEQEDPILPGAGVEFHVGSGQTYAHIGDAVAAAGVGDIVVVHSGTYHEKVIVNKPITLKAAAGEEFTVFASISSPVYGTWDHPYNPSSWLWRASLIITCGAPDYYGRSATIDGGKYTYSGTQWDDAAIKVQNGFYHTIKNVEVYGSHQGIWLHGGQSISGSAYASNLKIQNCNVHNMTGHGIYIQKGYATIEDTTIMDCDVSGIHYMVSDYGNGVYRTDIGRCCAGISLDYYSPLSTVQDVNIFDCESGFWTNDARGASSIERTTITRCKVGVNSSSDSQNNDKVFWFKDCNISFCDVGAYNEHYHHTAQNIYSLYRLRFDNSVFYECDTGLTGLGGYYYLDGTEIIGSDGWSVDSNSKLWFKNVDIVGEYGIRNIFIGDLDIRTCSIRTNNTSLHLTGLSNAGHTIYESSITSRSSEAVIISGGSAFTVNNCDIRSPTDAMVFDGTTGGSVLSTTINCSEGDAVLFNSSHNIAIRTMKIIGSGEHAILMNRSGNLLINDTNISADYHWGVYPIFEEEGHLDHVVEDSIIGGEEIIYRYEPSIDESFDGVGQAVICMDEGKNFSFDIVGPAPALIIGSNGTSIFDSNVSEGLYLTDNEYLRMEDCQISPDRDNVSIRADNSAVDIFNSTVDDGLPSDLRTFLTGGSNISFYNTTNDIPCDAGDLGGGVVKWYHLIDISVKYSDNGGPVDGVDYKVSSDGDTQIRTLGYGGGHPQTDVEGRAGPWWLPYKTLNMSDPMVMHDVEILLTYTEDAPWTHGEQVNTAYDHTLTFTTDDIRAPATPGGPRADIIEFGDGINISWEMNLDDTVLYEVFIKEGLNWTLFSGSATNTTQYMNVPNGTLVTARVVAIPEVGLRSSPSQEVEVTARDLISPEAPTGIRAEMEEGTNVTVGWNASVSDDVVGYNVYLVEIEGNDTRSPGDPYPLALLGTTNGTGIEIEGLDPETSYMISVLSLDEAGNPSELGIPTGIETPDITWPNITNLNVDLDVYNVTISWNTDQPTDAVIFFGISGQNPSRHLKVEQSNNHSFLFSDLEYNTTYSFYIVCTELSGNGILDDNDGALYSFTTVPFEGYTSIHIVDSRTGDLIGGALGMLRGDHTLTLTEITPGDLRAVAIPGSYNLSLSAM